MTYTNNKWSWHGFIGRTVFEVYYKYYAWRGAQRFHAVRA